VFLGDEVMDFMLKRFSRDLGSLMQLLDQLDAFALRNKRAITIPLLKTMLESNERAEACGLRCPTPALPMLNT
jgi:DnaA family protein